MDWGNEMTETELIKTLELFAHKLKNPLHAVGINLDVLKTQLKKKIPQEKDILHHLDIISTEAQRLNTIVMKYLNYLEKSDRERQKIDLKKLLEGK